jgi:hypothetical protein
MLMTGDVWLRSRGQGGSGWLAVAVFGRFMCVCAIVNGLVFE